MANAGQVTAFNELNPRQTAHHVVETLKRLRPNIVLGRFAQFQNLPTKSTNTVRWVRYRALKRAGVLREGITPKGKKLQSDPIVTNLEQIGDVIRFTDVALDTHPDDLVRESRTVIDEQIIDTTEGIYIDNLQGTLNVKFAGGASSRATVAGEFDADDLRLTLLALKKANAVPINKMLMGSINIDTVTVEPTYIGYCDPALEPVFRDLNNFVTSDKYASQAELLPGEFGRFENMRLLTSTLADDLSLRGTGGVPGSGIAATSGSTDIFKIVIFGMNAYGGVPFGSRGGKLSQDGSGSLRIFARTPKSQVGDELAQKAYVGWKARFNAAILQQKAIIRLETGLRSKFAA